MAEFDKTVQSAVENLYEDERLRSNLIDSEARVVLEWAEDWISEQVNAARDEAEAKQIARSELARVRDVVGAINAIAEGKGVPRLPDAVAGIGSSLSGGGALTRPELFTLLTLLASAAWKTRARRKG